MRPFVPGESFYNIIKAAIPNFVESDYPLFMEFVTAYVRFLEAPRQFGPKTVFPQFGQVANSTVQVTTKLGGPLYEARKLLDYRDVSTTIEDFKSHFLSMFAESFPNYTYVPLDYFVRALRQFYQSKGTVESIEWFFRTLFNENAEVRFPREDILKASDGTWSAPIILRVSAPTDNRVNTDVLKFYTGQRVETATGQAQVESVTTFVVGQADNRRIVVNELRLRFDSLIGSFEPGQDLFNTDTTTQVHTTILPVITGFVIESGGSDYAIGDVIRISEGPTGGDGYGASGLVSSVTKTAIGGVDVINGGDGFITGLPVHFVSTTGHGAAGIVDSVVYGELLLENGLGYVVTEGVTPSTVQLEDTDVLFLELTIDPFVNATSMVGLLDADYGTELGITQLEGVSFDSEIDLALAAIDEKPFMHPWVFTNDDETVATLANAACDMAMVGPTLFSNGVSVFAITSQQDDATTNANTTLLANVVVSDVSQGGGSDTLYLQNVSNFLTLNTNMVLKAAGNGVAQSGNVVLDGTANVVGQNTAFLTTCVPGSHLRFADASQGVVRSVVNNTFLTLVSVGGTINADSWSIIPTGKIATLVLESQRFYGKIKTIRMLTTGSGYERPPLPFVDSISARAQEHFFLDPHPTFPVNPLSANNVIEATTDHISLFADATLASHQDAGRIQTIQLVNSGVNYLGADDITITAIHGAPRTGADAVIRAITGALSFGIGQFTTTRSFLSSDKFLQDSQFYNDYTYVVRVAESFDRYKDLLLKLVHPAGFHPLGQVVDTIEGPLTLNTADMEISANGSLI